MKLTAKLTVLIIILVMSLMVLSNVSATESMDNLNSTDSQIITAEELGSSTLDYADDDYEKLTYENDNSDSYSILTENNRQDKIKYVGLNGVDDEEHGTFDNPYKTIKYAVSHSEENDTVFIFEGKYDENSIVLSKSLNIIGENKNVIIASTVNNRKVFESPYNDVNNNCFKFENLTFDSIKPGMSNAILNLRNENKNEIVNCVFENNDGQYCIWSSASQTIIKNCEFIDNTFTSAGTLIYLSGKGYQNVTNVTFTKTSNIGNGVLNLINVINRPNKINIENVSIKDSYGIINGFNIANGGYGEINNSLTVNNITAENNEFKKSSGNQGGSLFLMAGPTKLEITNSEITGNTFARGIFAGTSNETVFDVEYNLIYENTADILYSTTSGKPVKDYNMEYNYWGSENPDLGNLNIYIIAVNKDLNETKEIKNRETPSMNVIVNPVYFEGDEVTIEVNLNDDATGNVEIRGIDVQPQILQKGSVIFTIPDLLSKSYIITIHYSGNEKYKPKDSEIAFIVKGLYDNDDQVGCYKILNGLINANNLIELDKNYEYNSTIDSTLKEGILINKNVVIDGKGFSINTTSDAKLFNIAENGNLTLKNIVLLNYNPASASAITNNGKLKFDNVTFTTQKEIVAGNLNAAIVNNGEFIVNNSNFADSILNCSGNGILYIYGLLIRNSGNLIMENSTIKNNGILARAGTVQIHGGLIYNSGLLSFKNMDVTDSYSNVKASVSTVFGFILGETNKSDIIIYNSNFENNTIINDANTNSAMTNVIRASNGDLKVYDSKFINNTGSLNGGAIGYYSQNELVIENNLFDSNSVTIQGGAIFLSGNLKSNNNTFRNNFAGRNGGAIYVYGYYDTKNPDLGNVISTNDVFEYNYVESSPDAYGEASILSWGGAICSKAGNMKLINDTFYRNKALMGDGGAIANYLSSWLEVSQCIFKENEATRWDVWTHASGLGGAILIPQTEMVDDDNYATFNIEYSIFDNNKAVAGSALYSVPYQNVPCDFISNNNYWGSNNPFFRELIGKYQLSDVKYPDNYIIMDIEGDESLYIGSSNTFKIIFNIYENGEIRNLDKALPDWEVNVDSILNPLSNNTITIRNNEAIIDYTALKVGLDKLSVNKKYFTKEINVIKYNLTADIVCNNTSKGVMVNVSLSENVSGEIYINGIKTTLTNGVASNTLPKLNVGNHTITISYDGNEKYNSFSMDKKIQIDKVILDNSQLNTEFSNSNIISVRLPDDAGGRVLFDIDGNNYFANVNNGVASLDISSLSHGVKNINWIYLGDGNYSEISGNLTVTVSGEIKISGNKNMVTYYTDGSVFKVQIIGSDGKPVGQGKNVLFKINGKTSTVKTDKNGFASYKITQTPKKYTITVQYANVNVKNTITVKKVLTAKNLSKKKSKKIKYSATVKGKKAFKGKKVTFKINGKTYKAKTNKKGVATVYLKNLKAGKHKIVITYVKTKITKTIKIKK